MVTAALRDCPLYGTFTKAASYADWRFVFILPAKSMPKVSPFNSNIGSIQSTLPTWVQKHLQNPGQFKHPVPMKPGFDLAERA
jgi:hypothetical protein